MSLDVYLEMDMLDASVDKTVHIWIRENGSMVEITREEWDRRYPDTEPFITNGADDSYVFHGNITHNLNKMADEAGIYQHLWRPEELNITKAEQLIEPLQTGLDKMKKEPGHYCKFNPANGWGDYDTFVAFVEAYLEACKMFPEATITVSR